MFQWIRPAVGMYLNKRKEKMEKIASLRGVPYDAVFGVLQEFLPSECVTDLSEFAVLVQAFSGLENDNWKSVHFRGEKQDYGETSGLSTFFRENPIRDTPLELGEVRQFQESNLGQELMTGFRLAGESNPQEHPWWWFLTQHHSEAGKQTPLRRRFMTRLLDVTRDPFVALYLACADADGEDGVVHILWDLEGHAMVMPTPGKTASSADCPAYRTVGDFIEDEYNRLQYDTLAKIDYENLWLAYGLVKRLVAQSGEFLIQRTREQEERRERWAIAVDAGSKQAMLRQLKNLLNVSERTMMVLRLGNEPTC